MPFEAIIIPTSMDMDLVMSEAETNKTVDEAHYPRNKTANVKVVSQTPNTDALPPLSPDVGTNTSTDPKLKYPKGRRFECVQDLDTKRGFGNFGLLTSRSTEVVIRGH